MFNLKRSSSAVLQSRVAKYQSAVTAATMESTGTTGVLDSELGQIPPGGIQEQEDESDDEGVIKLLPKKVMLANICLFKWLPVV